MNFLGLMNTALGETSSYITASSYPHPHPEKQAENTHPEQVPSIYRYLHHALHLMYDEVVQATRKLMYYGQPSSAEKPDCVSKKTNVNT